MIAPFVHNPTGIRLKLGQLPSGWDFQHLPAGSKHNAGLALVGERGRIGCLNLFFQAPTPQLTAEPPAVEMARDVQVRSERKNRALKAVTYPGTATVRLDNVDVPSSKARIVARNCDGTSKLTVLTIVPINPTLHCVVAGESVMLPDGIIVTSTELIRVPTPDELCQLLRDFGRELDDLTAGLEFATQ